jgi:glutathione S-transferase
MNMDGMILPGIISGLALLVYYYTLFESGRARGRFKVSAPSHEGPEDYQRYVRAHLNTLEHLVLFLPGLWLFAFAVSPFYAAAVGIFWPIGRWLYARGYYQSSERRMLGLLISMPPIYILILGSLLSWCYQALSLLSAS